MSKEESTSERYRAATVIVLREYGTSVPVKTIASEINTRHGLRYNAQAVSAALQNLKKAGTVRRSMFNGTHGSWELTK